MRAFIFLQEHPYYAVTGEDGTYELTDVPPGQYQLDVWHESLGERRLRGSPRIPGSASRSLSRISLPKGGSTRWPWTAHRRRYANA